MYLKYLPSQKIATLPSFMFWQRLQIATGTFTKTILEGICCEEGSKIAQLHNFVLIVYV